jgi:type I restriction-modification system DNA methylase subunit
LIDSLYTTICSELAQSDIKSDRVERLKLSFSFIKANTAINDKKEGKKFIEELIDEIDSEINGFMTTHKYVDTVSQFYVDFLRYANDDKGLGIVLTPSHITDLFVELADVDKDSVVFDNCCGTGGFLVSAMKKMIQLAKGNIKKEKEIKNNQLVGIEYQDDIYALLISNMIIHRDGRTNIYLGDCFTVTENVKKKYKPTVGLLNPPYKTKQSDIEELEFVLNNLSAIQPGGKCVAIIPLSCVIENTSISVNLKQRILDEHTLEAVMSMPEELFHNSDVNVVTCIIVLTAHKQHPKGKKTWFGYWRKDGFEKVKTKGRIDKNHTWEETKRYWVNAYKNRDVIENFSLTKEVAATDEWCIEAYMVTDYKKIDINDYESYVKKYLLYSLMDKSGITEDNEGIEDESE